MSLLRLGLDTRTTNDTEWSAGSTAEVDLAQYTALMIEENTSLPPETYEEIVLEIGGDLKAGIDGLTAVMQFFSLNGHVDNLPLSVYVAPVLWDLSTNCQSNSLLLSTALDMSACPLF